MRNLDADFVDAHQRSVHERMREITRLELRAADEQTRRVMTFLLARGIKTAIDTVPDAFPQNLDPHALAERLVSWIEGG